MTNTRKIWKYAIISPKTTLRLPENADVVRVAAQENTPCVWVSFISGDEAKLISRKFCIIGTGQEYPMNHRYWGSVTLGEFEWHVFEDRS